MTTTKSGVLPNGLGYRFHSATLYLDKIRVYGRDYQLSVVRRTVRATKPTMLLVALNDEALVDGYEALMDTYARAWELFKDDMREVATIADEWDDHVAGRFPDAQ